MNEHNHKQLSPVCGYVQTIKTLWLGLGKDCGFRQINTKRFLFHQEHNPSTTNTEHF